VKHMFMMDQNTVAIVIDALTISIIIVNG
jgi:hypothetical protein